MITIDATTAAILTRSYNLECKISVWRNHVPIATDIPISAATEDTDRTLRIPERVTLTIPRLYRGVDYAPSADADAPFSANGQEIRVSLGVGSNIGLSTDWRGPTQWFERGRFLVNNVEADGQHVSVECVGLLKYLDEARMTVPYQPSGTMTTAIRALIESAIPVQFESGLPTDRAVPAGATYSDDRLANVNEILDAWPAECLTLETGVLSVRPVAIPTSAVLSLTDGEGGTIIDTSGSSNREGYNMVVARGTAADGGQISGFAYEYSGPKAYNGPFNPLPVPFFYQSPVITTIAQATAAAGTRLNTLRRSSTMQFKISMVPHPALQVGDCISVTNKDYTNRLCTIESLTLPYLAGGDQPMELLVQAVS